MRSDGSDEMQREWEKMTMDDFTRRIKEFMQSESSGSRLFIEFWKKKIEVERNNGSILDESKIDKTMKCLLRMVRKWRLYRPRKIEEIEKGLKEALYNITEEYNNIRETSLPELLDNRSGIKADVVGALSKVWNNLGHIKDPNNSGNSLLVMAPTKFLMFLWGQTPAFDSYLRSEAAKRAWDVIRGKRPEVSEYCRPTELSWPSKDRWAFDDWRFTLELIGTKVRENYQLKKKIEELSEEYFKTNSGDWAVPYGFFIDAYLWQTVTDARKCRASGDPRT